MRIFVPKESRTGERRVAITPDVIGRLKQNGLDVTIESGAGTSAGFGDELYRTAGATISPTAAFAEGDVVASVVPITNEQFGQLRPGTITISFLPIHSATESIAASVAAKATSFSLEAIPRISRAQSMDALTSQALCAGYRCALVGAELSPRFFPLLMTAAGTVTPAQVLVLGAGVAGLQAIATARRLGGVVSAYDVRSSSADEVRSMGATFIELELEALEGAGGYAREMDEARAQRQRDLLAPHIAAADVVITTAAVPGRTAPRLITKEMMTGMKEGSVIVDLASESGGNVEGSVAGETIKTPAGVTIWGGKDVPSQLPYHASQLLSRNIVNLLLLMTKEGVVTPDFEDEIVDASAATHNGTQRLPKPPAAGGQA
ncbi:MAG: NAD(P)(+) transhydrogenase (Re/Si-specific) subunit alpha [Actinobacteria bacterium]|uniref:proton-translocating NAD(P)(+) transhydrogenase n=1 Tax=freshwater metagenome TaxID=449393 RepID=A0A6J6V6X3_9ZZZZ|nr:NAD(P)(+) transhydrogenase (Re/Si-specific) subunit alpha [Actinomycetota bacterium]MSY26572.1 NAD(P)(+) transhydrogenase (Re/Si-specific) subunit alpha [Actinomycetota bacterium]MSZ86434.1 NAD(P)(+) transhydrogenase (Re/Si-specific) subunit alpha [Actinomycetota bacterium]